MFMIHRAKLEKVLAVVGDDTEMLQALGLAGPEPQFVPCEHPEDESHIELVTGKQGFYG